ncbi:MAG: dihydroneopterin aldolase [Crocinitomicaceae bacterium]
MKNIIEINGIKLYGHHGCLNEELAIGGRYIVDVIIHTDFYDAAKEDNLAKTVDYVTINQIVKEEMAIPSKLIETVGLRIINRIKKELKNIEKVSVKVIKINPPINGDVENVAIIIEE